MLSFLHEDIHLLHVLPFLVPPGNFGVKGGSVPQRTDKLVLSRKATELGDAEKTKSGLLSAVQKSGEPSTRRDYVTLADEDVNPLDIAHVKQAHIRSTLETAIKIGLDPGNNIPPNLVSGDLINPLQAGFGGGEVVGPQKGLASVTGLLKNLGYKQ